MHAVSSRLLATFRSRDFRLLWGGELLSFVGTAMFYVALSWQLYLLTHSAVALGLLGVVKVLPTLLLSLRGRLSSITMIFWMGGPQLGGFEAGLLTAIVGAPLAVTLGGISAVVFVAIMALAFPQLRTYQGE